MNKCILKIKFNEIIHTTIEKIITLIASSVKGSSHGNGPTFDCQTTLYGLHIFNSSITSATVAPTSDGYESPRFTVYYSNGMNKLNAAASGKTANNKSQYNQLLLTLSGIECAENRIITSLRLSSGN